ncbi:tetratricopeptide repeat protein [Facklamia languida]|uniref:Tetratricopeptide repeat protein n=1 Tax=Facklamia languida CCUG 37842 TaxID=883113 RepID=H3NKY4_9LACT|nr:tetratricopeptide repeat protein [Facklamia languida]EHR36262.1 hypothetical protein HMPREF9708_01523 [Facklamia languida CCUG 37842]
MERWSRIQEEIESLPSVPDQMAALDQVLVDLGEDLALVSHLVRHFADQWGRQGYREAQLAYYNRIYQIDPQDEWAYLAALTAYRLNDLTRAGDWLTRWQAEDLPYDYQLLKSQILADQGEVNASRKILEGLVKDKSEAYPAYEGLANLYLDQGLYQKAIFYLDLLLTYFLQVDPDLRRQWRLDLMACLLEEESIDIDRLQGLADLEDLPLERAEEFYLMGLVAHYAGDLQGARDYLTRAIDQDSEALAARRLLLEVLAESGDQESFNLALANLADLIPWYDPMIKDCLAYATWQASYPTALLDKIKAYLPLEEDPSDHYQLLEALVLGYLSQDQPGQASQILQEFGQVWADTPYYADLKGRILQAQGQEEAGAHSIQAAQEAGFDRQPPSWQEPDDQAAPWPLTDDDSR